MQRTMETMFLNLYEEIFKEEGKVDVYSSKENPFVHFHSLYLDPA